MSVEELVRSLPPADPDCPECGGLGYIDEEGCSLGRCEVCMPPFMLIAAPACDSACLFPLNRAGRL